ncbi:hypothetical protein GY21_19110 [Cryobacterium roopkundense]|uniref:Uncharacterized protein n=1 Tax=Cryobacterium roopkundense TaxID=1001240 RepID=A0A099J2W7_9MICO|nr:OadG family protein [Cryobacterium roopkundense]KGJ71887.1 hypothetical protein GY21_19110 [Cryobacterium roopkundense]MBB5640979.1 hypothetical protein [Cryobacterium roopkundense]
MHCTHRRRLVIAIVSGGLALLILIVVGLFGLFRGPDKPSEAPRPTPVASASPTPTANPEQPPPVLATTDPELFTRSVARALFNWDTRYHVGLSDWAQVLVDVADTDDAPAVASDVRGYFPAAPIWQQLTTYGTRQWIEVESVVVPAAWSTALEQASAGQIPPGTRAFTVSGTRYRAGTWNTQALDTERQVTFTVFVVCSAEETCTLLRLSQPDRPLE